MELLNQEILKQLLQCRHHQRAVKASVEFELKNWIEDGGHVDFFCTNQKQVTFKPMTNYQFDFQDGVTLATGAVVESFECQKISLNEIRNLFRLYFDRVTEETNRSSLLERTMAILLFKRLFQSQSRRLLQRKSRKSRLPSLKRSKATLSVLVTSVCLNQKLPRLKRLKATLKARLHAVAIDVCLYQNSRLPSLKRSKTMIVFHNLITK